VANPNLQRYVDYFEHLDVASLEQLPSVMTEDVFFADPFNQVVGTEPVKAIFRHMFDNLLDPKFKVTQLAMTDSGESVGMMLWRLDAAQKGSQDPFVIHGMSELHFADDGRVNRHIDHWDAGRQFYEKLPVIGWILKKIRGRLAV
jgi:steroid delta-isomerase